MVNIKKLGLMLAIFTVLFGIGGCRQQQEMQETETTPPTPIIGDVSSPKQGGKIKLSMRNPKTLNPITNMDKSIDQTLKLVFDTLVKFDENDQVIPHVADLWTINAEGTILDIKLKKNILWHDGTELTSKDIIHSLDSIVNAPDSPYKLCVQNIINYSAIDDHSVRIIYKEPFSGYAYTLYFPIIPKHIEDINHNPIGTGPYIFESFMSGKSMELKSNSSYFKGSPYIDQIEILVTPDPNSDLYSFDQGIINVISTDVIDWEKYAKNKKSRIHEYMTMYYDYIGFNFNRPIFQNAKVRQALMYGLDRQYLLEKVYLYHGEISDVPVSPFSWLYEPQSKQYDLDVDQAKELLGGNTHSFKLLVNNDNVQRKEVALAIRKMYSNIGIDLEIESVDAETYMERLQSRQYEMVIGGWDLSVVPDLSFAFHSSGALAGANYGGYVSSEMDQLLKNAFIAMDDEKFKTAYSDLQLYMAKELPYMSLYFKSAALIINENIKGDIRPHHMNIYDNIYEWYLE